MRFSQSSKRFTFEHKWLMEDDFSDIIQQSWEGNREIPSLPIKLERCTGNIKRWAGNRFNQLGKKISTLRKELDYLLHSSNAKDNCARIQVVEQEIEKLSAQEELHWKQRSRTN